VWRLLRARCLASPAAAAVVSRNAFLERVDLKVRTGFAFGHATNLALAAAALTKLREMEQ
jgi:hypothetical protein